VINYGLKQEVFIEKYFRLGSLSAKGWRQNLGGCPYCHDGRSKNPRSHFLFQNDEVGFQCFNCGGKHRFSGNNINTIAGFIAKAAWKKIGAILLELKKDPIFPASDLKHQEELIEAVDDDFIELIDYKEVELPDVSIKFKMKSDKIAKTYRQRFLDNKVKVKAYLSEHGLLEISKEREMFICMEGDYSNRLILPIYFDGKLVSWAARALFPTKTKYMYPPSDEHHNDRGTIIYGLDKIFESDEVQQIQVFESILDAWHMNGMAVLSKNITREQLDILINFNFKRKKLLFVLDNDSIDKWDTDLKGAEMGKIVMEEKQDNWAVSQPKFGNNLKDVSDSIVKYGWLHTYDIIFSSIVKKSSIFSTSSKLKMKMKMKSYL